MMKRIIVILVLLLGSMFYYLQAQNLIFNKDSITHTTTLLTLKERDVFGKSVYASGSVSFSSSVGYARIILSDDYGNDLLIYESIPLMVSDNIDLFNDVALESLDIKEERLTKITVELHNAIVRNLKINITDKKKNLKRSQDIQQNRVNQMNINLKKQNALWRAGNTFLSQKSYQEKKVYFGDALNNLNGYEYYAGGIFEQDPQYFFNNRVSVSNSLYVPDFDWRNRHGSNKPDSPYYNANGIGWITSLKNQGCCGSCWAFSAVGALEAMANLYYNQLLNLDLSEQQLVSCYKNSCRGDLQHRALEYLIQNNGVIDESSFPYMDTSSPKCDASSINITPCDQFPNNYKERINMKGISKFRSSIEGSDGLKKRIIQNGPMAGSVSGTTHDMVLVGYKTIKANDTINFSTWDHHWEYKVIAPDDPRIGQTVWIFKQSYHKAPHNQNVVDFWSYLPGASGVSEFDNSSSILTPITSLNYTDADIVCDDKDGDGYFYWGIGPKPAHCPPCAPDEPDGDDSNPYLGPMDEWGNCRSIQPTATQRYITTTETWTTPNLPCGNIYIHSGGHLVLTSTIKLPSSRTIYVYPGGKLTISGGTIENGNIYVYRGGNLTVTNNGKILLNSNDNLTINQGAIFEQIRGEVTPINK